MRVIAGSAKGRMLKAVPGKNTRPTTDKVKEALFNIIRLHITGGKVLDLFAGTGGLGIEALSRGMDHAIFVDQDRKSIEVIKENLETTNLSTLAEVYRNEAKRALKALVKRGITFDLIFLDPPYKMKGVEEVIQYLEEHGLLNKEGILVIEHDSKVNYKGYIGSLEITKTVDYGNTSITVMKQMQEE